jgi:hypothetical protein
LVIWSRVGTEHNRHLNLDGYINQGRTEEWPV